MAGTDFGTRLSLTAQAAVDDSTDFEPELATDGNGTWVAVWKSTDDDANVFVSRSIDDGQSWSDPVLPRPELADANGHAYAGVATNGSGTWAVAWAPNVGDVLVVTSTDNAATWNAPTTLLSYLVNASNDYAQIETDGAGTWIAVWESDNSLGGTIGTERDILFSRSTDNAVTWSAPAALNTDAGIDAVADHWPRLATDGDGVWNVVWSSFADAYTARSTDNGATWSAPVALTSGGSGGGPEPDIATDGTNRWIAVWRYGNLPDADTISYRVSVDDGASWTPESPIHPYYDTVRPGDELPARIASIGAGQWQIVWSSSDKLGGALGTNFVDILTSYTRDNGASWTRPAALTVRARRDGVAIDVEPAIAHSATGSTVVVWTSTDTLNGTIGSDYDIVYAAATRDCDPAPRGDCRTSVEPDGSKLTIRDSVGGGDRLTWRLKKAQATSDANLGNPLASDDYVLCLYEKTGGVPGLIDEWDAKAATVCRGLPCWKVEPGQVELRDPGLEQGSIKLLKVRGGADGQASIRLTATGPALSPPRLPLDVSTPVRIQLVNLGTDVCWEGVHDQADKNDGDRFVSTSD